MRLLPSLAFVAIAAVAPPSRAGSASEPKTPGAQTISIDSKVLGRARAAYVALPPSHAATKRAYPVIVVLDGEAAFDAAVTVARTLASLGHVPEAIVVGVPNATSDPRDRVHDLTPPGLSVSGSSLEQGGDTFLDFLEQELLTSVAERYRGGAPAVLVGHSSGGVLATWAAATRRRFQVVVAIDTPTFQGDGWLARRLIERAARPEPGELRYVTLEAQLGWSDGDWDALVVAAPRGWRLKRVALEGESHETAGFLATYQGLKFAFADYSIAGAPLPPRGPAHAAFDAYEAIGKELGADLPPPAPVLSRLIEDLLIEGRVEPARRALAWLVDGYGEARDREALEAMIARVAALPPLTETVETMRSTPAPTPDEIAPYLGTWRGTERRGESEVEVTVRLRVEEGRTVVESWERGPGAPGWRRFEYVKLLPGGLEFGRMNGMRPLGMWVWTARRDGEVLEGESGFRGIVLPLPDGRMPPTFRYRMRREAT